MSLQLSLKASLKSLTTCQTSDRLSEKGKKKKLEQPERHRHRVQAGCLFCYIKAEIPALINGTARLRPLRRR